MNNLNTFYEKTRDGYRDVGEHDFVLIRLFIKNFLLLNYFIYKLNKGISTYCSKYWFWSKCS